MILTPASTPIPVHPPQGVPQLTVNAYALHVRKGPGTNYGKVGVLLSGQKAEIVGCNADGTWWQINSTSAAEGVGWVSAAYVTAENVGNIPTVEIPPTPTPDMGETSSLPKYPAPNLIAPEDGHVSGGHRPDLIWSWDGDLNENHYFEVTIQLKINDQWKPIDIAWLKYPCYKYDDVPEGSSPEQVWEFLWEVAVVEGTPGAPKQWSPVEECGGWKQVKVWDPPGLVTETMTIETGITETTIVSRTETATISQPEEQRLIKVEVVIKNPPDPCPPGGCEPDPPPREKPPPRSR